MPQPTATPTPVQPAPTQTTGTTPTTQPSATATSRAGRTPEIAPTPFPEAARARQARFAPSRLTIPRIGIDAVVVPAGVTADGQLEAPGDYSTVGWYEDGPAPGETARAVIDGHLDSRGGPAVFYRLGELVPGDELIVLSGRSGGELTFIVRETASFPTAEVPLDLVFGPSDRPELVLITCDGAFDRGGGGYLERRIVFADLCDSRVRETCR
jgi:sortase (surface protein transpeptidase)